MRRLFADDKLSFLRQPMGASDFVFGPHSPPAWMKTNQSLVGGRLIDSPRIYDAYARYFLKFVRAYEREGVPIYALTLQNEPQNRNPNALDGRSRGRRARMCVARGCRGVHAGGGQWQSHGPLLAGAARRSR
jgi:hypothetical protein